MKGSIERVQMLFSGRTPDRPPLFDLLRNDAVLSHFAGEVLTLDNAERVVFNAYEPAIDATRPAVRMPHREETITLEDGRQQRHFRWTAWTEPVAYRSDNDYVAVKRRMLTVEPGVWGDGEIRLMDRYLEGIDEYRRRLGEVLFVSGGRSVGDE